MSGDRDKRALAKLEERPSGGNVASEPITIGLDKQIRVDMSKLPPPANVYDADVAWVEHSAPSISLMFGKRVPGSADEFRTRLEIRYPPENLVRQLWRNTRSFHDG